MEISQARISSALGVRPTPYVDDDCANAEPPSNMADPQSSYSTNATWIDVHGRISPESSLALAFVLRIDFRGFGESGGPRVPFAELRKTIIPEKWPGDVETAYAFYAGDLTSTNPESRSVAPAVV